ncbi:MAG TPA: helix-turn-helix transcriptional regulator [Clostridiaceae bacterium]|nr:helix-turn-helix transcriptional regulator [Clostridiaceae bacterium]
MEENNISGNKLSLESGIDRLTINRFMRKENKSIKIETITLICQALDISLKDFLMIVYLRM